MNLLSKLKVFFFGHEVKPGQVWGYCIAEGNPFIEAVYIKVTVVEIKEKWLSFSREDDDRTHWVMPISKFKNKYDELLEDVE
jgi:hypothetical protein